MQRDHIYFLNNIFLFLKFLGTFTTYFSPKFCVINGFSFFSSKSSSGIEDDIAKGEENCPICNVKYIQSDKIFLKYTETPYSTHNKVVGKIYIPAYRY